MSFSRINNNIAALNAARNLEINGNRLNRCLARLSTGLRINSAADDAAGLAISEKIRNQVRGLNQAIRNAQDGISLIQTGEGALGEVHNILQRMRELAVQAANDTYTDEDRSGLQDEIAHLIAEVDRISETTEFNTRKLLDGSLGSEVAVLAGGFENVVAGPDTASGQLVLDGLTLGTAAAVSSTENAPGGLTVTDTLNSDSSITINGTSFSFTTADTVQGVVDAINAASDVTGVTASFDDGTDSLTLTQTEVGSAQTVAITGTTGEFVVGSSGQLEIAEGTVGGTDATLTVDDANPSAVTSYTADGNNIVVTGGDFAGLSFTATSAITTADTAVLDVANNSLTFQVGAHSGQTISFYLAGVNSAVLGISELDIGTQDGAEEAITMIADAVVLVSEQRSDLGAVQNRLESTIANLGVTAENLTAADSRIRDADIAAETAEYTRNQILVQAATSVLAQANLAPQSLLALLG